MLAIAFLLVLDNTLLRLACIMAARTTEVLGLVLRRGQGLVAVCDSNERKGLVAVSKTMNREVRRAIMMSDAAFNRRYPELKGHFSFVPQYII